MSERPTLGRSRLAVVYFLACAALPSLSRAQAPAFVITPEDSTITFCVKASVDLHGSFDKWDATLAFTSTDVLGDRLRRD